MSAKTTPISEISCGTLVDFEIAAESGPTSESGIFLNASTEFVLLQSIEDWHSDGLMIVPVSKGLSLFRSHLIDARYDILKWGGLLGVTNHEWIDLDGYQSLFVSCKEKNATILIEDEESIDLGRVVAASKDKLKLKGVDGCGEWMEEIVEIPYSIILKVRIGTEYTDIIVKYADHITDLRQLP